MTHAPLFLLAAILVLLVVGEAGGLLVYKEHASILKILFKTDHQQNVDNYLNETEHYIKQIESEVSARSDITAEDARRYSLALIRNGFYQDALEIAKICFTLNENYIELGHYIIQNTTDLETHDKRIEYLADENTDNAFYQRAKAWAAKGYYPEAILEASCAIALDECNNPHFYLTRAHAWCHLGYYKEAISDAKKAKEQDLHLLIEDANELLAAATKLDELDQRKKNRFEMWLLGTQNDIQPPKKIESTPTFFLEQLTNQIKQTFVSLPNTPAQDHKLLESDKSHLDTKNQRSLTHTENQHHSNLSNTRYSSINDYIQRIKIEVKANQNITALDVKRYGTALLRIGCYDYAKKIAAACFKLDDAYKSVGRFLIYEIEKFHKNDKKINEVSEEIKQGFPTARSYNLLAIAWSEKGHYHNAILNAEKALALQPRYPYFHITLAYAYYHLRDYESATIRANTAYGLSKNKFSKALGAARKINELIKRAQKYKPNNEKYPQLRELNSVAANKPSTVQNSSSSTHFDSQTPKTKELNQASVEIAFESKHGKPASSKNAAGNTKLSDTQNPLATISTSNQPSLPLQETKTDEASTLSLEKETLSPIPFTNLKDEKASVSSPDTKHTQQSVHPIEDALTQLKTRTIEIFDKNPDPSSNIKAIELLRFNLSNESTDEKVCTARNEAFTTHMQFVIGENDPFHSNYRNFEDYVVQTNKYLKSIKQAISEIPPADLLPIHLWECGKALIKKGLYHEANEIADLCSQLNNQAYQEIGAKLKYLATRCIENKIDDIFTTTPHTADEYHTRAKAWLYKGYYVEAILDTTAAITLDNTNPLFYQTRAKAAYLRHHFSCAIADANKAINLNAKSAEAYQIKGNALWDKKNRQAAVSDLKKAVTLDQKYKAELDLMLQHLARKETNAIAAVASDHKKSLVPSVSEESKPEALRLSASNSPLSAEIENVDWYFNKAKILIGEKNHASYMAAIANLSAAIMLDDKNPDFYFMRATIWYLLKKPLLAFTDTNSAIKLNPQHKDSSSLQFLIKLDPQYKASLLPLADKNGISIPVPLFDRVTPQTAQSELKTNETNLSPIPTNASAAVIKTDIVAIQDKPKMSNLEIINNASLTDNEKIQYFESIILAEYPIEQPLTRLKPTSIELRDLAFAAETNQQICELLVQVYTHLADQKNHAYAKFKLGEYYQLKGDSQTSVTYFKKAAAQYFIEAQHQLGFLYEIGMGVTKNTTTAISWYKLAEAAGYQPAIIALARLKTPLQFDYAQYPELSKALQKDGEQSSRKNWFESQLSSIEENYNSFSTNTSKTHHIGMTIAAVIAINSFEEKCQERSMNPWSDDAEFYYSDAIKQSLSSSDLSSFGNLKTLDYLKMINDLADDLFYHLHGEAPQNENAGDNEISNAEPQQCNAQPYFISEQPTRSLTNFFAHRDTNNNLTRSSITATSSDLDVQLQTKPTF